ncbi:cuticle protein 16.8-like [Ornithodoros turicata]|uniref:cuticle protein 16.8-like n=1 Tax=Ornithodoros turicata TaxID=34597 RepID=UPI00313878F4
MSVKLFAVASFALFVALAQAGLQPAAVVASPLVAKAVVAAPVGVQSYSFGYDTADEYGTRQTRQETSDLNNVRSGSYGYSEANGLYRQVNYIADAAGFRATIHTNEPGTAGGHTAAAVYDAAPVASAPVLKAPYKAAVAAAPVPVASYHQPAYARPVAPVAAPVAAPLAAPGYVPRYYRR